MERTEFENRLKQIFCYTCQYDLKHCVAALLSEDTEAIGEMQAVKAQMEACIADYLNRFDAAETDEDRMAIVGSVRATDYTNF